MEKVSIKINIMGRSYPLTVARTDEYKVRQAAQMVNDLSSSLQETYIVSDKQDLLAMAALQIATKTISANSNTDDKQLISSLEEISKALDF